jgi:iron(III) transport system ATP-binding protein
VTHDQEEALTLSDQIAVFNAGFIEQIGTPQEIYHRSKTEFVCTFIGDINHLGKDITQEINNQTGSNLDPTKNSYIRTERISLSNGESKAGSAVFNTTITDIEFYGLYVKYSLKTGQASINCVDMESSKKPVNIGDIMQISIDPSDIMQY